MADDKEILTVAALRKKIAAKKHGKDAVMNEDQEENLDEAFDPNLKKHPRGGVVSISVNPWEKKSRNPEGKGGYEVTFTPHKEPGKLRRGRTKSYVVSNHHEIDDALKAKKAFGEKFGYELLGLHEGTKSFNTLMRSIQDKKSIKTLKVPTPAERKAEADRFAASEKKEPIKEDNDVVHSVEHAGKTYTIHKAGSMRMGSNAFKVRRDGALLSNHASQGNAKAWLDSHLKTVKEDLNESFKVGDRVTWTHTSTLYPGKQFKKVGKIIYDHGDGKFNVDTNTHFRKTKSYPSTVHADKLSKINESNLTPSSVKVKIIKNGDKHELTIRSPGRKITGYHQTFDSREDAEKFVHQKWGVDALHEDTLEEGRMSELHADIGDHMDKHIDHYRTHGGAEHLMSKAEGVATKIAKLHNIEHKHATKFVSDYIDSKLTEGFVLDAHESKMKELTSQGYKPHSLGTETGVGVESNIMKHGDTGKKIHVKTWRKSNSEFGQKVDSL